MFRGNWTQKTCGEDTDRSDLDLVGPQEDLVERIHATGVPTVVVLVTGRPLSTEWIAENVPALLNAWEPGMYGGQAVAEILYGKVNPSAKLAITIPRSVGQTQMIYNHKPSQYFHPYVVTSSEPLYPFGFGLSYTTFSFSKPVVKAKGKDAVEVAITVKNTGSVAGGEVDDFLTLGGDGHAGQADVSLAALDGLDDGVELHVVDLQLQAQLLSDGACDLSVDTDDLVAFDELVGRECSIGGHDQLAGLNGLQTGSFLVAAACEQGADQRRLAGPTGHERGT